jgi:hypothetical protein
MLSCVHAAPRNTHVEDGALVYQSKTFNKQRLNFVQKSKAELVSKHGDSMSKMEVWRCAYASSFAYLVGA